MELDVRPGLITAILGPRELDAEPILRGLDGVLVQAGVLDRGRSRSSEERQRLALERALAGGAEVVLLDRPHRALDSRLLELRGDRTVVFATSDAAQASRLADRIALVEPDGAILDQGDTGRILSAPSGERAEAFVQGALGEEAAQELLDGLEEGLQAEGELVRRALRAAVDALVQRDVALADGVTAEAEEVARARAALARSITGLLARRLAIATDLRLALALLEVNRELAEIAAACATIAKLTTLVADVEGDPTLIQSLQEMGERAKEMIRVALDSLANRDLAAAESLVDLDELIDRSNRRFVERVVEIVAEPGLREWVLRMVLVSRTLERIGDHAVDIGEQVAYLLTAEFREFTDASHPENA